MAAVALTTLALEAAGQRVDLTFPQWRVLVILGEGPDGARIGRVARRVGVTVPATGRLLRRMQRRGLVELVEDPEDRRATRASLTEEGDAVRQEIVNTRMKMLKEVAATVGDPDSLTLRDGLAAIVALLEPIC
jgi:DNA-binding MarR family transcriptional regulator